MSDAPDTAAELDFDARYSVSTMTGVAFYLVGYAKEWTQGEWVLDCEGDHEHAEICYLYNEPEEVENRSMVRAVMVGDDREHLVDVDDLTVIDDLAYCHECGQIGCTHDGLERE